MLTDWTQILSSTDEDLWRELEAKANTLRLQRFGLATSFVETHNINFTNVCTLGCSFCAFACAPSSPHILRMSLDKIIQKLASVSNLSEVCLQGGIDPHYTYADYLNIIKTIRKNFADIHIHAFSPQEIHHMSHLAGKSIKQVLDELKAAGLNSMPGTAAEILVDEIRKKICPQKIDSTRWVEIVKLAHQLGIPTSATVLFGHIEEAHHLIQHFEILQKIQDETHGLTELVLLPFVPFNTRLGKGMPMIPLAEIKKRVILARLFFDDSIPHIQMSWPKVGLKFAISMLSCGSNDIGGTLHQESIARLAGSQEGEFHSRAELSQAILSGQFEPWERNTLYQRVKTSCVHQSQLQ